jgi:hypothetical protein
LQITLIAAWFNYINRVADALGIGRQNEFEWDLIRFIASNQNPRQDN